MQVSRAFGAPKAGVAAQLTYCMVAQVRAGGLHTLRLNNNALQGPLPPLVESANLTDIAVANNNLSGAGGKRNLVLG